MNHTKLCLLFIWLYVKGLNKIDHCRQYKIIWNKEIKHTHLEAQQAAATPWVILLCVHVVCTACEEKLFILFNGSIVWMKQCWQFFNFLNHSTAILSFIVDSFNTIHKMCVCVCVIGVIGKLSGGKLKLIFFTAINVCFISIKLCVVTPIVNNFIAVFSINRLLVTYHFHHLKLFYMSLLSLQQSSVTIPHLTSSRLNRNSC